MSKKVQHLFDQFQPVHYILDLVPDREKMTFSGMVIISGKKTGRPSKRLTLHQNGLKVTRAKLVTHGKQGDTEHELERINHHKNFDQVRIHSKQMVYPGKLTVTLEFKGRITRQMNGMYPCIFDVDGSEKKLIATQFESHHAREVFPCIDEPEAKATFDLTLTTPKDEAVLANTPIKEQQEHGTMIKTTFETTPHMSTYLLAFVYGEMGYKEATTEHGTRIRTYATPANVQHTDFGLAFAVKCLEFYEEYFGIPYPLEKCDMIALPDFASGAMENWGCITYREQAMLVDEDNSTLAMKQRVAMVIAHELAHQWFGNLVTMRWWTDLWLNEGFASWIEFLAVDHIYPEWEVWTQFAVDEQQQAMKLDALKHTHPVEVPVTHPDEIRSIFDAISYSKGASVIHMLHAYLGPEAFQAGLKHYLQRHAYKNTDTKDLWSALEEISGKPVSKFMKTWTETSGFPLLHIDVGTLKTTLRQERLFTNPREPSNDQIWPIPLHCNDSTVPEQMETQDASFQIQDSHELLFNKGQTGFYRISYNAAHLERIGELIHKGHVAPIDRLGVLADVFEAAKSGKAHTADALHFIKYFGAEENYAVWDVISSVLGGIRLVMNDESLRDLMKPYTRDMVAGELKRLGWERNANESHFDRLLRPIILGLAAASDEPGVLERCRQLFEEAHKAEDISADLRSPQTTQEVKRGNPIDPDMRGVVFGTIARHGGEVEFNKLLDLHNKTQLSEEKITIAAALTGFEQEALIKRSLDLINSDAVRLQDVAYWIAYSFVNRYARRLTWQWLKDNWGWLEEQLGSDLSFYRTPIYAARVHSDPAFITEYVDFFKPKVTPALERSYNQGLEMLAWQSAWKARDYKEILQFFKAYQ